MDWKFSETISNQVIKTGNVSQTIIEGINGEFNPWSVGDASVFLRYFCPECDFSDQKLGHFKNHAVISHEKSKVLFSNESEVEDLKIELGLEVKDNNSFVEEHENGLNEDFVDTW
jgi:hypothetical protein